MNLSPVRRKSQCRRIAGYLTLYVVAAIILLSSFGVRAADSREIVLVAFGDSLTAGFGLEPEAAFPAQLERALKKEGYQVKVINAGVSGDTTAAGLARLDWSVPDEADAVIVELGANDALRGLSPQEARANLDQIVSRLKERGLPVLLAGMYAPRNLGPEYVDAFDNIYSDLAHEHGVSVYPFFLDGVSGSRELNLPDGLHPNEKGVAVIVENILPAVEDLLKEVK